LCLAVTPDVCAQTLRLVSEFQRVGALGEVVAVDRIAAPREILSPAVARNAYASFRVAVEIPADTPYFLYVQSNPADFFEVTLYKELTVKVGEEWIPDALQETKIPAFGSLPYLPMPIPGQTTVTYWVDLHVAPDATVRRVRLEVLMKIGNRWITYPMEVRVIDTVVPAIRWTPTKLPAVSARADAPAMGPLTSYLCRADESPESGRPLTARALVRRNALQDMALARALEAKLGRKAIVSEILRRAGSASGEEWCRLRSTPSESGPEWYLRVRDWLYRQGVPKGSDSMAFQPHCGTLAGSCLVLSGGHGAP
jgi:hypothetical protein